MCHISYKHKSLLTLRLFGKYPDQDPELNQPQIKVTPESRFTYWNVQNLQTLRYGLEEEIDLCESETYEYQSRVQKVD